MHARAFDAAAEAPRSLTRQQTSKNTAAANGIVRNTHERSLRGLRYEYAEYSRRHEECCGLVRSLHIVLGSFGHAEKRCSATHCHRRTFESAHARQRGHRVCTRGRACQCAAKGRAPHCFALSSADAQDENEKQIYTSYGEKCLPPKAKWLHF